MSSDAKENICHKLQTFGIFNKELKSLQFDIILEVGGLLNLFILVMAFQKYYRNANKTKRILSYTNSLKHL